MCPVSHNKKRTYRLLGGILQCLCFFLLMSSHLGGPRLERAGFPSPSSRATGIPGSVFSQPLPELAKPAGFFLPRSHDLMSTWLRRDRWLYPDQMRLGSLIDGTFLQCHTVFIERTSDSGFVSPTPLCVTNINNWDLG